MKPWRWTLPVANCVLVTALLAGYGSTHWSWLGGPASAALIVLFEPRRERRSGRDAEVVGGPLPGLRKSLAQRERLAPAEVVLDR